MDVDGLGDDSTLTVTDVLGGEWTPPYDVNSLMIADAAMPLHPACLVCCETHRDTLAGATGLWASTRLQLALAVAGMPLDRMAPALSVPLTPLHSLSSAVAAAPALPPSTARLWCDLGWCRPLNGASLAAASDDTAAAATSLESASAAGYVEMIARGEAMDSDACTVAQAEVELLHLDNACTEAMRARDGDGGGAHGIAEVGEIDSSAASASARRDGVGFLPRSALLQLMGASTELTSRLRSRTASVSARLQQLVYGATLLSTVPPSPEGAPVLSRLATELAKCTVATCDALGATREARDLAMLPLLSRALEAALRRTRAPDDVSGGGGEGGLAVAPPQASPRPFVPSSARWCAAWSRCSAGTTLRKRSTVLT